MQQEWPEHYEGADVAPEYYDDSIKRGIAKLDALRSGAVPLPKVGFLKGRVALIAIFALLPGLALLWWAYRAQDDPNDAALGWFGAFLGVPIVLLALLAIAGSRPNTPKRALRLFYKAVARANARRARLLSVPNDFDTFPRYQPVVHGLPGSDTPFQFAETAEFRHYWHSMLRARTMPYCLSYVHHLKLTRLADDVVVAKFQLTLILNTQMWILLIFVGLLPVALIGDLATRKTIREFMSKMLVRTPDGEWRIFNAEWQGQEEEEPEWLS